MGIVYSGVAVLLSYGLLAAPYQQLVRESYTAALRNLPDQIALWRAHFFPQGTQEFQPPLEPAAVAGLAAALYEESRNLAYAEVAFHWLALYDTLRQAYPSMLRQRIPQYAQQIPPVPDFFAFPVFCRAYHRIQAALSPHRRRYLQQLIVASAQHALHFPEWGAINRAVLRALGLELAAQAYPEAPNAQQWRYVARALVAESRESWPLEDAQLYWGIWLYALLLYGECADSSLWSLPQLPLLLEAALQLVAPFGAVAPFGDTRNPWETAAEFVATFEWAAARFQKSQYRWAAAQITRRWLQPRSPLPPYRALILWDAARWADTTLVPSLPEPSFLWCSDDAIVKKLVFRTGWDTADTYVLLNYRDAPLYGWRIQKFLHQSLPIEEEKGSHGHSDELSLVWFLHRGALLLTHPGYREAVPSGPFGAYRAEYFHNRVVVRPAKPGAGQSLWEFLRHAGTHRIVRTVKVDAWEFRPLGYARLRLVDEEAGYAWERLLIVIRSPVQVLVLDLVHFLRDGPFTVAQLWHGGTGIRHAPNHCMLATDSLGSLRGNTAWMLDIRGLPYRGQQDTLFPTRRFGQPAVVYARWQTGWYRAGERAVFATRLTPAYQEAPYISQSQDSLVVSPTGIALRIVDGDTIWLFTALWDVLAGSIGDGRRPQYESTHRMLSIGPLRSDADFAFARQSPLDLHCGFAYGTAIWFGESQLFHSLPNLFPLQLDGSPPRSARLQWRAWETESP
ncbi:MAG: hypothetical protein NZ473_06100 [Candidatus Kapabacteria bacterium]|nr:hypothetical protein [Candidatus Kapabacteria bacterium]MCS7169190.1 hypothetical protein [Candidatus Kapabacteria bacterium]MDW7996540.1 hypothetical protein [Bacteroidota bacterium]MDW8225249.1 hypothetical protein [Bacteroidota bacterium]